MKFFYADEGDGWNDLEITAQGMKIKSVLNGVTVVDYDGSGVLDDELHKQHGVGTKGVIGLQIHSFDELKLRFKDLRIKDAVGQLGTADIEDGTENRWQGASRMDFSDKDDGDFGLWDGQCQACDGYGLKMILHGPDRLPCLVTGRSGCRGVDSGQGWQVSVCHRAAGSGYGGRSDRGPRAADVPGTGDRGQNAHLRAERSCCQRAADRAGRVRSQPAAGA